MFVFWLPGIQDIDDPSPHTHTHTPQMPPTPYPIQTYKHHLFSCMPMNMHSLFCLSATGPVSAYQCAGVMQAARNSAWFLGYVLCMKSLSEAFYGGLGNKGSCSLIFSFQGTLENILWEQGSKTNVTGIGKMLILKITLREHVRLFLGNMVPPRRPTYIFFSHALLVRKQGGTKSRE